MLSRYHMIGVTCFIFGILLLAHHTSSRAIHIEGTVTEVETFEFIQRLVNPCGIVSLESDDEASIDDDSRNREFYQSMIIAVDKALEKLEELKQADSDISECLGIRLDLETLPSTQQPHLHKLTEDELFKEIYTSLIFLAAHLHLMGLDRQLSFTGVNNANNGDIEGDNEFPSWRDLRCGKELNDFMSRLTELTMEIENILCNLVTSADLNQRASFRQLFDRLSGTTFFGYHSSCSSLQTRDCIGVKETENVIRDEFNQGNNSAGYYIHSNELIKLFKISCCFLMFRIIV